MRGPHENLASLRAVLARGLQATQDLLDAPSLCRSLAVSDLEGAGAFFLLALYFENLERLREGVPVDADKYQAGISELVALINDCLDSIESFDPVKLSANLDSFARMALRHPLP